VNPRRKQKTTGPTAEYEYVALTFQIGAFGIDERSEIDFDSPVKFRS